MMLEYFSDWSEITDVAKFIYLSSVYSNLLSGALLLEHMSPLLNEQGGMVHGAIFLDGPKNKAKNFIIKIDKKYLSMINDIQGIEYKFDNDFAYFIIPFLKLQKEEFVSFWNYKALSYYPQQDKNVKLSISFYGTEVAKIDGSFSFFILYDGEKFIKRKRQQIIDNFVEYLIKDFQVYRGNAPLDLMQASKTGKLNTNLTYEHFENYYIKACENNYIFPFIENIVFSYFYDSDDSVTYNAFYDIVKLLFSNHYQLRPMLFYKTMLHKENWFLAFVLAQQKLVSKNITGEKIDKLLAEAAKMVLKTFITLFDSFLYVPVLEKIISLDEININIENVYDPGINQLEMLNTEKILTYKTIQRIIDKVKTNGFLEKILSFIDKVSSELQDYKKLKMQAIKIQEKIIEKGKNKTNVLPKNTVFRFFDDLDDSVKYEIVEIVAFLVLYSNGWEDLKSKILK